MVPQPAERDLSYISHPSPLSNSSAFHTFCCNNKHTICYTFPELNLNHHLQIGVWCVESPVDQAEPGFLAKRERPAFGVVDWGDTHEGGPDSTSLILTFFPSFIVLRIFQKCGRATVPSVNIIVVVDWRAVPVRIQAQRWEWDLIFHTSQTAGASRTSYETTSGFFLPVLVAEPLHLYDIVMQSLVFSDHLLYTST